AIVRSFETKRPPSSIGWRVKSLHGTDSRSGALSRAEERRRTTRVDCRDIRSPRSHYKVSVRGHAFRLGSGIGHGFSTPARARWVANTVSGNAMAVLPRIRSSRRLIQLPRCRGRLVGPNYPLPVHRQMAAFK